MRCMIVQSRKCWGLLIGITDIRGLDHGELNGLCDDMIPSRRSGRTTNFLLMAFKLSHNY
jgi:hypothetical protein